jgi:microcystin-dependent protein
MPTTYKGLTVPLPTDLADGPKAFQDYTDTLPTSTGLQTAMVPVGTVVFTCRAGPPAGWLVLNGVLVVGGQTLYPELWNVMPASWRVGADIQLPNVLGRLLIAIDPTGTLNDIGELGGAATVALTEANLPPHAHAQQGAHASGGASARHVHGTSGAGGSQFLITAFAQGTAAPAGAGAIGASFTGNDLQDHAHTTTLSGPTGNGNGTAAPVSILPPVIAFVPIIRAA